MSLNLVRATAIVFAVAMFASAARGADGAIEISQACVATGCGGPAADPPGFPIATQSGEHYVLTSNLTVPDAGTIAVILASQASLDMNGFAIIGPALCIGKPAVCTGTGSGAGVVMSDESTLRNGTIRGMGGEGIRGAAGTVIEDMLILRNGGNGINQSYSAARITGCRVLANGGDGIEASPGGGAGGESVAHNVVYANHGEGIRVATALVLGNTATSNGSYGIGNPGQNANIVMALGHNLVIGNLVDFGDVQLTGPSLEVLPNACGTDKVCP
jgi:hypothetical protein